ncbi:MAG: vanadium-dependent haloperoxidase [Candidatus Sulfotelmatobacter sp.]|jgi:membrane-associated phospholipid phosphatase
MKEISRKYRTTKTTPENGAPVKNSAAELSNASDANSNIASIARRKFIGKVGGAAAAAWAASAVTLSPLLGSEGTKAHAETTTSGLTGGSSANNPVGGQARKNAAYQARLQTAIQHFNHPLVAQVNNGDESLYANDDYIGNYSKCLQHDAWGDVVPSSYQAFMTACTSGLQSDFEAIPLGGDIPLVSPQAGLFLELEGNDTADVAIAPAPTLASAQRAGEMVELYWHALCRDVPFWQYGHEPLTAAAIADLNKMTDFRGPKQNGAVTARTLFRGFTSGDLVGPYMSQFLLMPIGFGMGNLAINNSSGQPAQQYNKFVTGLDYMTDSASWLAVQNGQASVPSQSRSIFFAFGTNQFQPNPGYLYTARDVTGLIHVDELFQHYFWGAAELLGEGFPLNPGCPYSAVNTPNETAFATYGGAHITGAMADAALRAIHTVWYQKYYVHRDLRPEEYGGWVHNTINQLGLGNYNLHSDVLNSQAVQQVFSKYGTYYLPMAFPEGCPQHPSYGSGHATVAGAAITMLKAYFDCSTSFVNQGITPVFSPDGVSLTAYTGSDVDQITVGTELNKLASNVGVGRNLAGVHWRADYQQSLLLGETVAINILKDVVNTFSESNVFFQFPKFDGATITISKTGVY